MKGSSSSLSDVCRTPRLVAWSALMREVGVLDKGEGENKSYLIVAWLFECLSYFEGSKVNKSNVSGGCARVRVPTVVA